MREVLKHPNVEECMMVDIGACLGRPVTLHRASRIPGEPVFSPSVSGSEITRRDARVG